MTPLPGNEPVSNLLKAKDLRKERRLIPVMLMGLAVVLSCRSSAPLVTPTPIIQTVEVPVTREVIVTAKPEPTEDLPEAPIIFSDSFNEPGDWEIGKMSDGSLIEIKEGKQILTEAQPHSILTAIHPDLIVVNQPFVLDVDVTYVAGDDSSAGIVFRYADEKNSGVFYLSPYGLI